MNTIVMKLEHTLTIALTKGRILKETLPLLAEVGIAPQEDLDSSRKLIVATTAPNISLVILRGSDVPTYVRHGAADVGIAGKDMLLEFGGEGIYEPLDLGIARCRLMTAGPASDLTENGGRRRVRVATKFINVARAYYARKGLHADLIKLYGSMELAPLMGLADEIVDIVDTGKTLAENGMAPRELIADISSRLIVNKASMRTRHASVQTLVEALTAAVKTAG
jgi:ATP phosphoribosyltransferase